MHNIYYIPTYIDLIDEKTFKHFHQKKIQTVILLKNFSEKSEKIVKKIVKIGRFEWNHQKIW